MSKGITSGKYNKVPAFLHITSGWWAVNVEPYANALSAAMGRST
ncbi:hypothetical protein FOQG_19170 [Fusarium oxysporum f. sp. raphani 54005]|uniref:Uncharacterized protein n=1 Tax=Fusarium oxysporum f. sp. raphani 54005 TaxID=1089458 RepID=X0BB69_FUSOX|nr:hypothetical protein FOQG_19170 [Fusarium oxysporum f. sp. raphani 54005]